MALLWISKRLFRLSLLVVLIVGSTIVLVCWYIITRYDGNASLPTDCGIVFGAAVRRDYDSLGNVVGTSAGPGISRRMETAIDLYKQNMIKTLYVTGGKGDRDVQSEAAVMRHYAIAKGVLPEDIVVEEQARSTWDNLVYTKPLLKDCETVIAISDRYHLARIEFLAYKMGWDLQILPSAWKPTVAFEVRSVVREAFGILYYMILFIG
jgi:vancomycin permeability regulator SanA